MADEPAEQSDGDASPGMFGFQVPKANIDDPFELGAFSFGSTFSFTLAYVITQDYETASIFAVPGGGMAFGVVRMTRNLFTYSSVRRTQKLTAKVRWEVTRLRNAEDTRALTPLETERLNELDAILRRRLYETSLMKEVLKRTEPKRGGRRAIEGR